MAFDPFSAERLQRQLEGGLRQSQAVPVPQIPQLAINPVIASVNANHASEFHERFVTMINNFDNDLDADHEVGVRLVSFGQSITFHLTDLGYWNPSLITFSGFTEDGNPVELIQHVSQISVLLMKLPRLEPDKPKRPIGFHSDNPEDGG